MTHDELLKKLWEKRNSLCDNLDVHFGLSAVVQLHKPYGIDKHPTLKSYCTHCEHLASQIWPCPTIQAIEKELR